MIRLDSLILLAIPWIIFRVVVLTVKKQLSLKNEMIKALFYFSIIFIYSLTLFPFPFYAYSHMERGGINLTPFATIYGLLTNANFMFSLRNIVGNILLFIPLGFSIPLRFKVNKFWKVILLGFFTSCLVEVIQLFTSIRSFDVDDLILNTIGAIIGLALYRLFDKVRLSKKAN
ncbi:VanZ family protein [Cytobacillus sp. FJAT-53684]|uniref:VanZ family protein n=1 Tax=Cytobacillus mangrovibacter TaxID=3299024 RepID=A0ABW6JVU1_9BACI